MGFFDRLSEGFGGPDNLLAASNALLQAGAPSRTPVGFGQALGMAGQSVVDAKKRQQEDAMKKMLLDLQLQEHQLKKQQLDASVKKEAQKAELLSSLFGPGMSPGAFAPSVDGRGPTMPTSMQKASGIGGMDIDQIAKIKALGGIDLMDAFKWAKDPLKLDQGATYQDRLNGQERYMPKVGEGMAPDKNGFYAPLPGYAQGQAQIEGAKTTATEGARAALDLVSVPQSDGSTRMVPRAQAVRQLGDSPRQTGAPLTPELQQFLMEDARKNGIASPSFNFQTAPGQTLGLAPQFGVTQSPAAKEAATTTAKLQSERDFNKPTTLASVKNQIAVIDKALTHPGRETATGLSGTLDPRNYIPGTNATNFQKVLDQIGGATFLQAFESLKGGGAITQIEGEKATSAMARLSRAQSDPEFKVALKDLRDVMQSGYDRLNGTESPKPEDKGTARVNSDADYNALPSGATFVGPDGKTRRKP